MNSNKSYNPRNSRVIIQKAGGNGNTENFKFLYNIYDDGSYRFFGGLLTSYNMDYVLKVSPANDGESWRELRYVTPPGPIPFGPSVKTFPSWVTRDMLFTYLPSTVNEQLFYITSMINDSPIMGVLKNKDEVGNFVVMLPRDGSLPNNEIFTLENYDDNPQKRKNRKMMNYY